MATKAWLLLLALILSAASQSVSVEGPIILLAGGNSWAADSGLVTDQGYEF